MASRESLQLLHHTRLGLYLAFIFALFCLSVDSTRGIVEKYHFSKKWFYLYGLLMLFAYLYMRPYLTVELGSAVDGVVNFYSLYILWLCSAVFYHLPSFSTLGIDVKGDLSLLISVFLSSLVVIGCMQACYALLVYVGWIRRIKEVVSFKEELVVLTLNSISLSVACSSYFSFCGNGANLNEQSTGVKSLVCSKWLHPLSIMEYPTFSAWVVYGEVATSSGAKQTSSNGSIYLDLATEGLSIFPNKVGDVISPVFTLWITLVTLYIVNALADHQASSDLQSSHISELRRQVSEPSLAALREVAENISRTFSKEHAKKQHPTVHRSLSLDLGLIRQPWPSATLAESLINLVQRTHRLGDRAASLLELHGVANFGQVFSPRYSNLDERAINLQTEKRLKVDGPQPNFLPMVPWYSGTSADLFKTMFDLMVSVKLFLGRFDMRTMQAATAASMADSFNDMPSAGDGFTFEHYCDRDELWIDFMADTGDGGDPTYTVARAVAAPKLTATFPDSVPVHLKAEGRLEVRAWDRACITLPRADLLLLGGDLAYPHPSAETYEQRLFVPFQDALPPPRHYHPGRLVVHKPDLPPADVLYAEYGVQEATCARQVHGLSPRSSRSASVSALCKYSGPNCFAIPGNHDWIDGLETFIKQILHRGWLGGWLLPQEKSYFALRLPHGWWVFGLDLALVGDIDMCQYRYFANVVEQAMQPEDQVIIITHEPIWLLEWFWAINSAANIRQLVRGHLRGRSRVHLAGDLHFYMRHSFRPTSNARSQIPPQRVPEDKHAEGAHDKHSDVAPNSRTNIVRNKFTDADQDRHLDAAKGTPISADSTQDPSSEADGGTRAPQSDEPCTISAAAEGENDSYSPQDGSSPFAHLDTPFVHEYTVPGPEACSTENGHEVHGGMHVEMKALSAELQPRTPFSDGRPGDSPKSLLEKPVQLNLSPLSKARGTNLSVDCGNTGSNEGDRIHSPTGAQCPVCLKRRSQHHLYDPEHLIVNGLGGAFLHPTHVFANARFCSAEDQAAEGTATIYSMVQDQCICNHNVPECNTFSGDTPTAPAAEGQCTDGAEQTSVSVQGEYSSQAIYPPPKQSLHLGKRNLLFRLTNSRFDVVGGALYFLSLVSVLPRCGAAAAILNAQSFTQALQQFVLAFAGTVVDIFSVSYISLGTVVVMFLMLFGFARSGGVGADCNGGGRMFKSRKPLMGGSAEKGNVSHVVSNPQSRGDALLVQVIVALSHSVAHLITAITLMLVLELGVETCIRYESLGKEGAHSLYRWFQRYEQEHFPDPMGRRELLRTATLGLYPAAIKYSMALFDVPEAIAVACNTLCRPGGGLHALTRAQALSYYLGMLAYYWLMATPMMGCIFGVYLYISVCWFHCHYDEAFSSLRIANHKGFTRMHIRPDGDLELFTLAVDKVPSMWKEDPKWRSASGGGNRAVPSYQARYPSRWLPVSVDQDEEESGLLRYGRLRRRLRLDNVHFKVVDALVVPRKSPHL